jgi:outer membrane lipoprotein-sorting protein
MTNRRHPLRIVITALVAAAFAFAVSAPAQDQPAPDATKAKATAQPAPDGATAAAEVLDKYAKIEGLEATLEMRVKPKEGEETSVSSVLSVSRALGWKIVDDTPGNEQRIFNDYRTSFQYFPREKRAVKLVADMPAIVEGFRKPAGELNPLTVLDPKTVKFLGADTLGGEAVYHFSGTTSTQLLAMGAPVARTLEAWVSPADGLPRKTIETTPDGTVVVTVYSDVKANPQFSAEDFRFTPPEGVEVLDMNAEMKKAAMPPAPRVTTGPALKAPATGAAKTPAKAAPIDADTAP